VLVSPPLGPWKDYERAIQWTPSPVRAVQPKGCTYRTCLSATYRSTRWRREIADSPAVLIVGVDGLVDTFQKLVYLSDLGPRIIDTKQSASR